MNTTAKTKTNEPSVEELTKQIEVLKKDIATLTNSLTEVAQSEARRAVETAKAKGADLRNAGEDQLNQLRATAEDYGRQTGEMVREQPVTALGVAAGVGFILGFLMSSRR